MLRIALLLCLFFIIFNNTEAGEFKIRAREHFDNTVIHFPDHYEVYNGIGPMFDLVYEEPFELSIGFNIGLTLLDNISSSPDPRAGESAELRTIGLSVKYYTLEILNGLFFRGALTENQLSMEGTYNDFNGLGAYGGVGWEFNISKIGLAFEAAWHLIDFSEGTTLKAFSPAIGVHFYEYF